MKGERKTIKILDCIKNCQVVRTFTDTPIPDDVLTQILNGGNWAPSGANSQPTEFIVVKNKVAIEKIRKNVKQTLEMSGVKNIKAIYDFMKKTGAFNAAGTQKVS